MKAGVCEVKYENRIIPPLFNKNSDDLGYDPHVDLIKCLCAKDRNEFAAHWKSYYGEQMSSAEVDKYCEVAPLIPTTRLHSL